MTAHARLVLAALFYVIATLFSTAIRGSEEVSNALK